MPSDPDGLIGQEIDGYRILSVLGRGGMGIVYKAEDIELARNVALKMIDPGLVRDPSFLRRFRDEARALARIDSPHIVSVYTLRQTPYGWFIVMEYVEGGTLGDVLKTRTPSWQEALPIIIQMLRALEDAHSVGIIHRDIKPGNIMLTPDGSVKVTDFGLAKVQQGNVEATVTQGMAGTPYYMSPEQVRSAQDIDHRSDLYAVGMTVYQMLAGRLPFEDNSGEYEIFKTIVETQLPPPSYYKLGLPDPLVQAVERALEKDPADRFQNAREMRESIEGLLMAPQALPVELPPSKAPSEQPVNPVVSAKPPARGLRYAIIGVLALIVVAGGFWGGLTLLGSSEDPVNDEVFIDLSIDSNPPGAIVRVGGVVVGETPLRNWSAKGPQVAVRLEKIGFTALDTLLEQKAGAPITLAVALHPDAKGEPLDDDVPPAVASNETNPVTTSPGGGTTKPQEPTPKPQGTLNLLVKATGPVSIDGERVNPTGPFTLPAGRHQVTCGQGSLRADTTVAIRAGQPQSLTCYFEGVLSINTMLENGAFTWGGIQINGVTSGETTPRNLLKSTGTYRIHIRRDGYEPVDPEQTVVVKPSFYERTYPVVFRLRKNP